MLYNDVFKHTHIHTCMFKVYTQIFHFYYLQVSCKHPAGQFVCAFINVVTVSSIIKNSPA